MDDSFEAEDSSNDEDEDIYDVETIVNYRWNKQKQTHQYRVKWLNYSARFNQWIDEVDLSCDALITEFNNQDGRKYAKEEELRQEQRKQHAQLFQASEILEEENEEDDSDFILDMKEIPYKIVDDIDQNGFDRGWEVEKVLLVRKDPSDNKSVAVVKFRGVKYSQQFPLSVVDLHAPGMPKPRSSDIYDDQVTDESESSNNGEEDFVVEKIVKRQFNHTTKCPDLLEEFNEKRKRHRQKKHKDDTLDEFIVADDEPSSTSDDERQKERKHKQREEKRRTLNKAPEHAKARAKLELRPEVYSKKKSPPRPTKKKKLGAILSYDQFMVPEMGVDFDRNDDFDDDLKPSTSAAARITKIKKEPSASKKNFVPSGGNVSTSALKSKCKERGIKVKARVEKEPAADTADNLEDDDDMASQTDNFVERHQMEKLAIDPPKEPESDEEEESDMGFVLDMKCIPYKILPEDGENGFDRGWEVEKILALTNVKTENGAANVYGIVKFKGFKYSQQIPIEKIKEYASTKLLDFLHEKIKNVLTLKKK
ncbi:chromo (CHRromatin organization MOdifier) domain-containing protein [Ditylenchus destructor]|nr:chromo (CHRromatin organization MOdifier) domain-containing protein [Ditylenchus destructor]